MSNNRIQLENVTKTIHGATVLDHVSLELEGGKVYGLSGKNGSGKTMLMRAIAGLIFPTSGTVTVNGKKIGKDVDFPDRIGVLIENPAFLPMETGFQNLKLLADIKGETTPQQIRHTLERVGLDAGDRRRYHKYSLGMKQRLGIAAAVMETPDVILLDEPFNALDESGVVTVRNIIREEKERGAVIVMACHNKEELLELSDQIIGIVQGKITARETDIPDRGRDIPDPSDKSNQSSGKY